MAERTISNPVAANQTVTDYTTGVDASGRPIDYPQDVEAYRAGGTFAKGDALMFVAPTTTAPVTVVIASVADLGTDPWRFAGVADEAGVAGKVVQVVTRGFCVVNHDASDTPAAYSLLLNPDATAGKFQVDVAAATGESVLGVVYGAEIGATNTCFAYVGPVAEETTA